MWRKLKAWWRWHVHGLVTAVEGPPYPMVVSCDFDVAIDLQTGERTIFKAGCLLPDGWRWATEADFTPDTVLRPIKRGVYP